VDDLRKIVRYHALDNRPFHCKDFRFLHISYHSSNEIGTFARRPCPLDGIEVHPMPQNNRRFHQRLGRLANTSMYNFATKNRKENVLGESIPYNFLRPLHVHNSESHHIVYRYYCTANVRNPSHPIEFARRSASGTDPRFDHIFYKIKYHRDLSVLKKNRCLVEIKAIDTDFRLDIEIETCHLTNNSIQMLAHHLSKNNPIDHQRFDVWKYILRNSYKDTTMNSENRCCDNVEMQPSKYGLTESMIDFQVVNSACDTRPI
jgi:hypothetical protein